ncbi:ABC transporter ATP-binding protein [Brevibacterium casei]|uniref:ATP-binding cassette domain-containing protein n=1 Tax=Brevibacterium casei TaxID=33889 RepID=A0A7T3ZZ35_9MICO|nr:ATP-binding cassette domain-containing protein [Brevibacterium casei]QQB14366.1 ATP-binding cassette domain-containing protein [Brevibacterium casei]
MTVDLISIGKQISEPNGETRVLFDDLGFRLGRNPSAVAIMGRSGSGKTTLLRIIAGLDSGFSGTYRFQGEAVERDARRLTRLRWDSIGYVTQSFDLLNDRSVLRNVMFGCPDRRMAKARSLECLERLGIGSLAHKSAKQLSGGEAQRVAIARAMVKEPEIILADEPTGSLDAESEDRILGVFEIVKSMGTSLVIATHSERVSARCDKTLHLIGGRLCESTDSAI